MFYNYIDGLYLVVSFKEGYEMGFFNSVIFI